MGTAIIKMREKGTNTVPVNFGNTHYGIFSEFNHST